MQGRKLSKDAKDQEAGEGQRKRRVGNFQDVTFLNMAYGDPLDLFKDFARAGAAAANFGTSRQTIRRARSLAAKSSLLVQDRQIKRACQLDRQGSGVRALKVGWDETSVRLFCDLEKAQRLLPQMNFTEDDSSSRSTKNGGVAPARPSFRMQVMQQHVCAKIGESMGPVQVPANFVKSTTAEDLYSGCSAFALLDLIKKDAPDDDDVLLMGAFADSLESNKNVVVKWAVDHRDAIVVNGVCMGCRQHV